MNRRNARFLALAAASLLIVGVFAGREMASWRPVKLARFAPYSIYFNPLHASNRFVSSTAYIQKPRALTTHNCFDVVQEKLSVSQFKGEYAAGVDNNFFWSIQIKRGIYRGQPSLSVLEIIDPLHPNKKRAFQFMVNGFSDHAPEVKVLPEQNSVMLLSHRFVYKWNFQTGTLQHQSETPLSWDRKFSRDGRTFMLANSTRFEFGAVSTGIIQRMVYFKDGKYSQNILLSPHGQFALIFRFKTPTPIFVVSTATGKTLWTVSPNSGILWSCVFADDERTIFVRSNTDWQLRDLKTGAVLRRLPIVPGVTAAASSPNGATLYSVANGVLYRQRAR